MEDTGHFLGIQMETGSRSEYTGSWILLKSPKILDPWILLDLDPSGSGTLIEGRCHRKDPGNHKWWLRIRTSGVVSRNRWFLTVPEALEQVLSKLVLPEVETTLTLLTDAQHSKTTKCC